MTLFTTILIGHEERLDSHLINHAHVAAICRLRVHIQSWWTRWQVGAITRMCWYDWTDTSAVSPTCHFIAPTCHRLCVICAYVSPHWHVGPVDRRCWLLTHLSSGTRKYDMWDPPDPTWQVGPTPTSHDMWDPPRPHDMWVRIPPRHDKWL